MGMVEIIRGPERRRRWSVEEKLSIVAEAERSGASVSAREISVKKYVVKLSDDERTRPDELLRK